MSGFGDGTVKDLEDWPRSESIDLGSHYVFTLPSSVTLNHTHHHPGFIFLSHKVGSPYLTFLAGLF